MKWAFYFIRNLSVASDDRVHIANPLCVHVERWPCMICSKHYKKTALISVVGVF